MAEQKTKRSHVSGFVRAFRENKAQDRTTFKVCGTKFIVPMKSTFGEAVASAALRKRNVLIIFESEQGKTFPRILDVFLSPTWAMVSEASRGLPVTYYEFVEVAEGSQS